METSHKIRNIVILVLIVVLIAAGAYFWFSLRTPDNPQDGNGFFGNLPSIGNKGGGGNTNGGGNTDGGSQNNGIGSGSGTITLSLPREIVQKDILAPTVGTDGKSLLYILRENGHVVASDLEGADEQSLVNLTVLEAYDAVWSKTRDRVAMSYNDNGVIKHFLNAVATGTVSRFLPQGATSYDFSPDGKSIAYIVNRASDSTLVIADAGNKTPNIVYTTPIPDFTVKWASKNIILLVSRPSGIAPSLVLTFDTPTKKTTPILSGARGIIVLPAPDGASFVFSESDLNGSAQQLARYTFKTGAIEPFNITTLADKCGFSKNSKILYCGVPEGGISGTMPDDWYRGDALFTDVIVAIDIATNQTITLAQRSDNFNIDATSPFTSNDGLKLFFQNRTNEHLWVIDLSGATTTR